MKFNKTRSIVWRWSKRFIMGVTLFITFLIVGGAVFQWLKTKIDENRYPPPGELVDIGGYRLHLNCMGEGDYTVVMDSGMGTNSLEWTLVQSDIAKFSRVCSYDRAGNGWSEESPLERTSENIVEELHTLLKKAKIPGPYILVGHSFGGVNALLYCYKYPNEVAGIVLVDSSHEDQLEKMPSLPELNKNLTLFLTYVGGIRLLKHLPEYGKTLEMFPDKVQKIYPSISSTNKEMRSVLNEMTLFNKSLSQLKTANTNLANKPLTVITAGKSIDGDPLGLSTEQIKQITEVWNTLQKDLVTKSTKGKQIIAENSSHMITRDQPKVIVQSVYEILQNLSS